MLLCLSGTCILLRAIGANHPAGRVIGWGGNISGEATGQPSVRESAGAVRIPSAGLNDITAIAAGLSHSLALTADGRVVGWGNNMSGRAIGYETDLPFRTNGVVRLNGVTLSNVVAIAAGLQSVALLQKGQVVTWGNNASGEKLLPPHDITNIIAVAASLDYNLALTRNGLVLSWGNGPPPPVECTNVTAIAVSGSTEGHALALLKDRSVLAWALRHNSFTKVIGATNVTAIAAGDSHYLALEPQGTVLEWGTYHPWQGGLSGMPAESLTAHRVEFKGRILENVVAIAAGGTQSLALKSDGTLVAWGINYVPSPTPVVLDVPAGLSGVVAIAVGEGFCLALTTNNPAFPPVAPTR